MLDNIIEEEEIELRLLALIDEEFQKLLEAEKRAKHIKIVKTVNDIRKYYEKKSDRRKKIATNILRKNIIMNKYQAIINNNIPDHLKPIKELLYKKRILDDYLTYIGYDSEIVNIIYNINTILKEKNY